MTFITPIPPTMSEMLPMAASSRVMMRICASCCSMSWVGLVMTSFNFFHRSRNHSRTSRATAE